MNRRPLENHNLVFPKDPFNLPGKMGNMGRKGKRLPPDFSHPFFGTGLLGGDNHPLVGLPNRPVERGLGVLKAFLGLLRLILIEVDESEK